MGKLRDQQDDELVELTLQVRNRKENDEKYAKFRGDNLIGNQIVPKVGILGDIAAVIQPSNWPVLKRTFEGILKGTGIDGQSLAAIAGSLSDYSVKRQSFVDKQVKDKYDKMLHPPLTYLGDAFQYRSVDGKFNSVLNPHLGQAGAPYAKTVPSKTAPLGALPDPADLFDKLMARQDGGRQSKSGLSAMLLYHATIIIHDIFRTNDDDKNISDSSSYLDLSPLYGYTPDMQAKIRDNKYKLGLLKPDTFAEDRLLRQPPGVCILLVMYNRYHNYAARQLLRINENGKFSIPKKYGDTKLVSLVKNTAAESMKPLDDSMQAVCSEYERLWREWQAENPQGDVTPKPGSENPKPKTDAGTAPSSNKKAKSGGDTTPVYEKSAELIKCEQVLEDYLKASGLATEKRDKFEAGYDAAWTKLDDDLFHTARLITCGMYIQISVHDYLRALMGLHQFDTNLTLDPRADFDQKKTSRGIGNQVTVEFNLLYRFHCAISLSDEAYIEEYMKKALGFEDPSNTPLPVFLRKMAELKAFLDSNPPTMPWDQEFGIPNSPKHFARHPVTNLFDDQQMLDTLTAAMDEPLSNFGPRNVPKCLKPVEIMGIIQARKWEVGTLNDFREFFGMFRHPTFESVTKNVEMQNALRDLYEHPDKIELYPGIFCESDEYMGLDPGPAQSTSALWTAIFSDAITLVRSDRFYTVDWNTNSLTSWGMKEVAPDNDICKSSVFHRLIQRAFPGWFHYNTIRFFSPFYTAEQNAAYAQAQGYGPMFRETQVPEFDLVVPPPSKPQKPIYLYKFEDIHDVLETNSQYFINHALYHRENLPRAVADVLDEDQKDPDPDQGELNDYFESAEPKLRKYLQELMRYVVRREAVAMTHSTFQIDATRDFAIPVVTRYVADFLGFGDKIRTVANLGNNYTENEIYQHITNCQTFLSYNADETKLLKRRNDFKASMAFLTELTQHGNIFKAKQWYLTPALFGKKQANPMAELGVFIAGQVLKYEKDSSKAAAILLLVCLDFAYHGVVSFTAVLDDYMKGLYYAADLPAKPPPAVPEWIVLQHLAFSTVPDDQEDLERMIQVASQEVVRLPIVRRAKASLTEAECRFGPVEEGQTIILDLSKATARAHQEHKGSEIEFLSSQLSIADKYGVFQPKRLGVLALTAMVKFVAQMKNPRRGHDAQGRLKKVHIDESAEGYANYMAPMRVAWIRSQAFHRTPPGISKLFFTDRLLRPETDTYLTPNWDEMIPFPMTWKVRFDGFGQSDYKVDDHPYGRVKTTKLPDYTPPFYQPQGASHFGGTFADVVCICAAAKAEAEAKAASAETAAQQLPNGSAQKAGGVKEEGGEATEDELHEMHCPCFGLSKARKQKSMTTDQLSTGCGMGK